VTPEELAVTRFPPEPSWLAAAAAATHGSSTSKNVINVKSFWVKVMRAAHMINELLFLSR
jgi:hypothetical protein